MQTIPLRPGDPLVPQLLAASRSRTVLDCHRQGGRGAVAADALREACLRADEADPFGLRLTGALVEGELDLSAVTVDVPLHLVDCSASRAIRLEGADLRELVISADGGSDACLGGLMANGLHLRGDLVLSGMTITGTHCSPASTRRSSAIWLANAHIDGQFMAVGTRILTGADRAVHADGLTVSGAVRFVHGFRSTAEIRLLRARIGGSVDLSGAHLAPRHGHALHLGEAALGSLFLLRSPVTGARATIAGGIVLDHARLDGRLLVRGAMLQAPTGSDVPNGSNGPAVSGAGVVIAGGVVVESDVEVNGAITFPGATIGGGIVAARASLSNPGGVVLDLARSEIRAGLNLAGALVRGTVDLADADVAGSVDLTDVVLSRSAGRRSVYGVGLRIGGGLLLRRAQVRGGAVWLRNAAVSGVVDAEGAALLNAGGSSLNLQQATVGGNVRLCGGFRSIGVVVLNSCDIAGRLRCDGGTFQWVVQPGQQPGYAPGEGIEPEPNVRGSAVQAISTNVRSGIGLGWSLLAGTVDLTDTHTSYLADDVDADWPGRAHLSGFTYDRFAPLDRTDGEGIWSAAARIDWLTRVAPGDPRPWGQVARVLRSNGDDAGADAVLMARRRMERARLSGPLRRLADRCWDVSVGYGYRPQRAGYLLLALVLALWVCLVPAGVHDHLRARDDAGSVFSPTRLAVAADGGPTSAGACGDGRVRCFVPLVFAVDTIVPVIDLHQRSTWYTAPDQGGRRLGLLLNVATVLGWAFSTVLVLALTRFGKADQSG